MSHSRCKRRGKSRFTLETAGLQHTATPRKSKRRHEQNSSHPATGRRELLETFECSLSAYGIYASQLRMTTNKGEREADKGCQRQGLNTVLQMLISCPTFHTLIIHFNHMKQKECSPAVINLFEMANSVSNPSNLSLYRRFSSRYLLAYISIT